MISVRFPYALTSHAVQPELGCNALDPCESLSETDIHHVAIGHRLLKSLDTGAMWITDAITDLQRPVSGQKSQDWSPKLTRAQARRGDSQLQGLSPVQLNMKEIICNQLCIFESLHSHLYTPTGVLEANFENTMWSEGCGVFFCLRYGQWNLHLRAGECDRFMFLFFVANC